MKAPNEKLTEILFNRYFMQSFKLDEINLYSPSSREEYIKGYDSKLIGKNSCRELLLQFKTPNIIKEGKGYTIRLNRNQHLRLLNNAAWGAFYVSHVFNSISDIQGSQSKIKQASEFLKYYIAINVHALPDDTVFLQYSKSGDTGLPIAVKYKTSRDGSTKKARHLLFRDDFYKGTVLLKKFKQNIIGQIVYFKNSSSHLSKGPSFQQLHHPIKSRPDEVEHKPLYYFRDDVFDIVTIGNEKEQDYNRISTMRQYKE